MGTPVIFLFHGEAYGNLGDEAMLLNAVRRITAALGDVHFVVPRRPTSPLPDIGQFTAVPTPGDLPLRLVRRLVPYAKLRTRVDRSKVNPLPAAVGAYIRTGLDAGWRRILGALRGCDAVYFVGAANLNDLARYLCLLPKCIVADYAHRRSIPTIFSSQTVGPLRLHWTIRAMRRVVEGSTYFSTRDGGVTRRWLELADIETQDVEFSGDEAHSLPPASDRKVRQFLHATGLRGDSGFAVLHFRETDYTGSTAQLYPLLAEAIERLEYDRPILFLPMSYHGHDDSLCGRRIRELLRRPERLVVADCPADASIARGVIGRADWVTALSYHAQVFAVASRRPLVLLSSGCYYQVKAEGMRMLLPDRVPLVDLSRATPEELAAAIRRALEDQDGLQAALDVVVSEIDRVNDRPVRALCSAMGRPLPANEGVL